MEALLQVEAQRVMLSGTSAARVTGEDGVTISHGKRPTTVNNTPLGMREK